MGQPPIVALASSPASVRAEISRAAERTGQDFDFLLAQARIESSLNPAAKASTSSATGLYQFTDATWLGTLERHGAAHGYGWASSAISDGRITDPRLSSRIMSLRYDAAASSLMAGELAGDNRRDLARALGRQPSDPELYLGHFLGSGDASRFLVALADNPDASAMALLPRAGAANRSIFQKASGAERSLGEVMQLISTRLDSAKTGREFDKATDTPFVPSPLQTSSAPLGVALPVERVTKARPITDTLKSMFGGRESATQTPAIRAAYDRFERFGL